MSKATVVYQGGQTTYNFPFDYLAKAFVKVAYIHIDGTIQTLNYAVDYKVVDKSIVCTLVSVATDRVKIYRETSTTQIVTFVDSSILRSKDLNALDVQLLHISEESMDRVDDAGLSKDEADGKWNAKQIVIKNVADGVSQYDAVNRGQLDTIAGSTSAAAASAVAAHQSELNASASASSAGVSASNATSSAAAVASSASSAHTSEVNAAASVAAAALSASQAETLKNQTATLEGQTQVLHDDTKVMHDEVMTATPSRCLPLTGGTVSGSITANDGFYGHLHGTADSATTADNATTADSATHAGTADSATTADNATHATTADSATHAGTADSATTADNATHATTADVASSTADNAQIVNLTALRTQTRPVLLWSGNTAIGTGAVAIPVAWSNYNIIHITWTDGYENRLRVSTLVKGLLNGTVNNENKQIDLGAHGTNAYAFYLIPAPSDTGHLTFFSDVSGNMKAIHGICY